MTDTRTPLEIADEAERILKSEVLMGALKRMEDAELTVLLSASGPDADITRREKAAMLNVIRALPAAIESEMVVARKQLKPRGGVA